MRYLSEYFVSYGSFLETTILLTSISSTLESFLLLEKLLLLIFSSSKFILFPLVLILSKNFFYNNLGVLFRLMKITQYLFYNKSKIS